MSGNRAERFTSTPECLHGRWRAPRRGTNQPHFARHSREITTLASPDR
jgi:hypothetical protein